MTRAARILATLAALVGPSAALAHEGPPFPILVDQRVGPYLVSVWTDPDIGTGTFYVVLETPAGVTFVPPTAVRVAVAPMTGRLAEAIYAARSEPVRRGARFFAEVGFDRGEQWRVRVIVESSAGGGELTSQVEATPDGSIGPVGLALYSFPFVLIAVLWWRVSIERRRSPERGQPHPPLPAEVTDPAAKRG